MKQRKVLWVICLLGSLTSGCVNIEPSLSGSAYDEYVKSIKPYMNYWQKEGMTNESRLESWLACGGNENGTFSWKTKDQLPGESNEAARTRQEFAFQHCLIDKGYSYTGDCTSDYMMVRPLCAQP